jgi:hypothetical protein
MWDVYCRLGRLNRVVSFDLACDICYLLRGRGVTVWMVRAKE